MHRFGSRLMGLAIVSCVFIACSAFQYSVEPTSRWLGAAYRFHGTGAVLFGLMGLVYIRRKEFMPYHAIAVGKQWHELGQTEQTMFLASMRIIGSSWIALSIALGIMLRHGFREGELWAVFGVPVVGLAISVPTLLAVLTVKKRTPASPPWPPLALVVFLFAIGLVLSLGAGRGA